MGKEKSLVLSPEHSALKKGLRTGEWGVESGEWGMGKEKSLVLSTEHSALKKGLGTED